MRGAPEPSVLRPSAREPSPKRPLPCPQDAESRGIPHLRLLPDPSAHNASPPANRRGLPPLPFSAEARAPTQIKPSMSAMPPMQGASLWDDTRSDLTPRAVGPALPSGGSATSSQRVSGGAEIPLPGERAVELGACRIHHVSEKVAFVVHGDGASRARRRSKAEAAASSSVWSSGVVGAHDPAPAETPDRATLVAAGKGAAKYLQEAYPGAHMVVLSDEVLSTEVHWACDFEAVDGNIFEPPPVNHLQVVMRRLSTFLAQAGGRVVVFAQPNCYLAAMLLAEADPRIDLSAVHERLLAITGDIPLAGTARTLAMLRDCLEDPSRLDNPPTMTLGSLRLHGDHDFVRSTEELIRVHVELHHSGYIDSSDFREQMLYRITRSDAADASLVIHFLPVELSADVRVVVYSTLAGDMGLITGPQPMFQLVFHTAFVDCERPLTFSEADLDKFQGLCPVRRVDFVPGPRDDEQLQAPEVKFVRKKVKKRTLNPITAIGDMFAGNEEEGGSSVEVVRPVESRKEGRLYRGDNNAVRTPVDQLDSMETLGADSAYTLPDAPDYPLGGVSGGSLPGSGRNTPRRYASPKTTRSTTPVRGVMPGGGQDTGRQAQVAAAALGVLGCSARTGRSPSPNGGRHASSTPRGAGSAGPPSPRIPVPANAGMDGEIPRGEMSAAFLSGSGRNTPRDVSGRNSPQRRHQASSPQQQASPRGQQAALPLSPPPDAPAARPPRWPQERRESASSNGCGGARGETGGARAEFPLPSDIMNAERQRRVPTSSAATRPVTFFSRRAPAMDDGAAPEQEQVLPRRQAPEQPDISQVGASPPPWQTSPSFSAAGAVQHWPRTGEKAGGAKARAAGRAGAKYPLAENGQLNREGSGGAMHGVPIQEAESLRVALENKLSQGNPGLDVPTAMFYADADLGFATPRTGKHRGGTPTTEHDQASPAFDTLSAREVEFAILHTSPGGAPVGDKLALEVGVEGGEREWALRGGPTPPPGVLRTPSEISSVPADLALQVLDASDDEGDIGTPFTLAAAAPSPRPTEPGMTTTDSPSPSPSKPPDASAPSKVCGVRRDRAIVASVAGVLLLLIIVFSIFGATQCFGAC